MGTLIEMILEIVIEGVFVTATYKRVPIMLRILAGIFALAVVGGVIFLLIYLGIGSWESPEFRNGKFVGVLMFIGAGMMFIGLAFRIVQFLYDRNR